MDLLGAPVREGQIVVQQGSRVLATGELGPDGTLKVSITLEERGEAALSLYYEATGHYLETSAEVILPVFLATHLALTPVDSGMVGTPMILAGELRDDQDNPLGPLRVA